ncbi:hypothetical protein [Chthoniobacter flavus]|nr:hypothetical protein [Chthoniobacter flavus]
MRFLSIASLRFFRLLLGAVLIFAGAQSRGEEPIPTAFPRNRYDAVRAHSPFAVATVEAPPSAPTASFAANWFVSGIARVGDEDFVTIKSRDLSTQFSLFGKNDTVSGVALASVTWSEAVGKSTVTLRKGTETAKLEFNEAEMKATPAPHPGTSPVPGAVANGGPRPVNNQPLMPKAIPGQPPIGQPPIGQPAPPSASPQVRRRVQVIQPPPR